jgi:hypothetical protein
MQTAAHLAARLAVEDAVIRMFVATDERDWSTLENCFTNPFILDMTSMVGGAPTTSMARDVARTWAEAFKPLDHVHHQIGNLRTTVSGDQALVRCYGVAFHHRAKISTAVKTRVFVGTYELHLRQSAHQWLIERLIFTLKFIDGNLELET